MNLTRHNSIAARVTIMMVAVMLIVTGCSQPGEPTFDPVAPSSTPTLTQEQPVSEPVEETKTVQATRPPDPTLEEEPLPTQPENLIEDSYPALEDARAFPDANNYEWVQVTTGIGRPLDLQPSPDGTGRLFILAQRGVIRVYKNGELLPEPFLDIAERVGTTGNERGLLGLAFHPSYPSNGFFYLNYTDLQGNTVISRFTALPLNPDVADPGSELVLLRVNQPYANHNGGGMVFGPDGFLYISLGDGGSGGDPQGYGQATNTLLGKLLRIDVDGTGPGGQLYAIPPDNPFVNGGGEAEIWAYGLRNAWRFSFDRLTGDLYIADVGQNAWEEVNFTPAGTPGGLNFGWNVREGTQNFGGRAAPGAELVDPVFTYGHDQGCSVTGGYVYRGSRMPEFTGIYLVGDYCSGFVWGLMRDERGDWNAQKLFETGYNISSFGQDENGEIYVIDQSSGSVYRLQPKESS